MTETTTKLGPIIGLSAAVIESTKTAAREVFKNSCSTANDVIEYMSAEFEAAMQRAASGPAAARDAVSERVSLLAYLTKFHPDVEPTKPVGLAGWALEALSRRPACSRSLAESIVELEALSFSWDRDLTNNETESMALVLHELRRLQQSDAAKLAKALHWALEWIDAVPKDVELPAMPGFDRDYVVGLLARQPIKQEA